MADFTDADFSITNLSLITWQDGLPYTFILNDTTVAEVYIGAPPVVNIFKNRVYDSSVGLFVSWDSPDYPDPTGTLYPGPGTFGVDTSDYCVSQVTKVS